MKNTILPVQPSLILRTDNYQRLDSDLDGISHYYRYCVKDGKGKEFHAVPDGSTDLLFEIGEHGVNTYMGGTVLQVKEWEMEENCIYFGVRFLPGKALFPQGMTIGDVVDADVCVENQDLAGNLAEKIALEKDFQKQAAVFQIIIAVSEPNRHKKRTVLLRLKSLSGEKCMKRPEIFPLRN